jgi:AcrR family transcriptional regulator
MSVTVITIPPDVSHCHRRFVMSVTDTRRYDGFMARWTPGGRGRLHAAALELYAQHGFDNTTVAEIAQRAGLTERTYFRHFRDKREVLFAALPDLREALVGAVANAPASLAPLDAVAVGLEAAAAVLPARETARQRRAIIAATPELQERDLIRSASLSTALADALRARGVADPAATLAGEIGMAVFRVASDRWLDETDERDLPDLIRESLHELERLHRKRRAGSRR